MDRRHELEILRRSLAMLAPGTVASLSREEAMTLASELAEVQVEHLHAELRRLVDEADDPSA